MLFAEKGLDTVSELLRVLINQATQAERVKYLNAGQYERKGHTNGYKPKTVRTRVGEITFTVPRFGRVVSILLRWRKACGAKEPW